MTIAAGGCFTAERREELLAVVREFPEVLVVEDDHNADIAEVPLHTLSSGGLPRWAHVRTVSKHLGVDLRWAAVACDAKTLARHDGQMLLTSGWVSHVLQETVLGLMTDQGTLDPQGSKSRTRCGWPRTSLRCWASPRPRTGAERSLHGVERSLNASCQRRVRASSS
ncbi:hypothetical protein ACH4SP_39635 [Streptomyces sp. NPDC021093]|uniref:hypothetical protein n=1 Tax=Streptomyces sp. NPDC021093 TaxID=3365112 RepID=UPI0037913708